MARRSDALKSALLDSVSHDLRTPLASIRATAGNLADPAVGWSPDGVRRAADTIDSEAQRLDRLVGSVLDLSRIESGALQPDLEVYDAAELIERAVARLRPTSASARHVDMAADLPLILVDAVLFDAIVTNILDNVVDHTPPDTPVGHPASTCRRHRRRRSRSRTAARAWRTPTWPGSSTSSSARGRPARAPGAGWASGCRSSGGWPTRSAGPPRPVAPSSAGSRSTSTCPRRPAPPERRRRPMTHARRRRPARRGRRRDPPVRRGEPGRPRLPRRRGRRRPIRDANAGSRPGPDLILLDLGLPDDDGLVIIRRVRRDATTPILVLSARDAEPDKVTALENGADDYVTKPFGLAELRARIGALLRRAGGPAADPGGRIVLGPVVIDVARRSVTVGGNPVELTPREYELLKTMFSQPGPAADARPAAASGLGRRVRDEAHYLHVYVSRIRRKLDAADPTGAASGLIVAEPGVGYRIAEARTEPAS